MSCQIHVDDIGTAFVVTIVDCTTNLPVDVSAATEKKIKFTLPDKSALEKTAEFLTDGSDGKIKYSVVDGDLSQAGLWKIQGFIVEPTFTNNSNVEEFRVYSNLS